MSFTLVAIVYLFYNCFYRYLFLFTYRYYCFLFQHLVLNGVKQELRDVQLEENRKRELACALHVHFRDWLYGRDYLFPFLSFACLWIALTTSYTSNSFLLNLFVLLFTRTNILFDN